MTAIGAFDAKNRLGHLLDAAERGRKPSSPATAAPSPG